MDFALIIFLPVYLLPLVFLYGVRDSIQVKKKIIPLVVAMIVLALTVWSYSNFMVVGHIEFPPKPDINRPDASPLVLLLQHIFVYITPILTVPFLAHVAVSGFMLKKIMRPILASIMAFLIFSLHFVLTQGGL